MVLLYCTDYKGIEALTTHLEHYLIITMILYTEFIRENYRVTFSCYIILSVKIHGRKNIILLTSNSR